MTKISWNTLFGTQPHAHACKKQVEAEVEKTTIIKDPYGIEIGRQTTTQSYSFDSATDAFAALEDLAHRLT